MLERLLTWWQGKLFVLRLARLRRHRLHHHHHPLRRRRHRARRREPLAPTLSARARRSGHACLRRLCWARSSSRASARRSASPLAGRCLSRAEPRRHRRRLCSTSLAARASSRDWRQALFAEHGNPLLMIGVALLLFPKLALGLSGFETGVAVMPLVKGDPDDDPEQSGGPHSQHQQAAAQCGS